MSMPRTRPKRPPIVEKKSIQVILVFRGLNDVKHDYIIIAFTRFEKIKIILRKTCYVMGVCEIFKIQTN